MREGLLYLVLFAYLTPGWATPLDDYVNKPDPTYEYKILSKVRGVTHTLYTLNMTSQSWKSSKSFFLLWLVSSSVCPSVLRVSVLSVYIWSIFSPLSLSLSGSLSLSLYVCVRHKSLEQMSRDMTKPTK